MQNKNYILWYKDISIKDIAIVGGKNASLGEIASKIKNTDINVPDGFALTTEAYWYFIKTNKLEKKLENILYIYNL